MHVGLVVRAQVLRELVSSPPTKSSTLLRRAISAFMSTGVMPVPPNRLVNSL